MVNQLVNQTPVIEPTAVPAPAPVTGRKLVVCCDGTNNTLTGGVEDTNVLMLYGYLLKHTSRDDTVLFYDPGVGTPDAAPPTDLVDLVKRKATRIAGLASGRGVYDNIAEAYRFLMNHWQGPQDRIFCFGFSRGAFTARCVVGMVNMFGVIRPEHDALLPTLIRIYFSQPPEAEQVYGRKNWRRAWTRWLHQGTARPNKAGSETASPSEESTKQAGRPELAEQVRRSFGSNDPARRAAIHWVGVWDTVESVGLPVLFARDNPATASFHDKPGIHNVRHALALDEHRMPFLPRLYDAPSDAVFGPRTLKQRWFPGVHCDVGGSYQIPESGLADAAWLWMFNEVAPEFGLAPLTALPPQGAQPPFDDLGMQRHQAFPAGNVVRHDALWDTPLWALAGMTVRDLRTHRVATNGEAKAALAAGKKTDEVGVLVDVQATGPALPQGPSVWDQRRALWPAGLAALLAVVALVLSGWSFVEPGREGGTPWTAMPAVACQFAMQQLASAVSPDLLPSAAAALMNRCGPVAAHGLRDGAVWQAALRGSPAWGLVWDFAFIACLGYLISRFSSRVFTFLAGYRRPGQGRPAGLLLVGLLPVVAVLADAGENVLTLLAMLLQRLDSRWAICILLFAVGVLSVLKLLAYAGCVLVFVPVRAGMAVMPKRRVGQVGREVGREAGR